MKNLARLTSFEENNARGASVFSLGVFSGVILLLFFRPLLCGVTYGWTNTYAQILIIVLLGLWVAGMLIKGELKIYKISLPILLFSTALIISTVVSISPGESARQFYQFLSYPLLYLIIVNALSGKINRKEGLIIVLAFLIASVIAGTFLTVKVFGGELSHSLAFSAVIIAPVSFLLFLHTRSPILSEKDRAIQIFIMAIFLAAILVIVYGIYQHYIGLERMREFAKTHYDVTRLHPDLAARILYGREVFSTFLFSPALASYLGIILPIALSFFIYLSNWKRIFPGVIFISGVFCLYLTFSYGGWVSSLFAIFLVLFISLRKYRVHLLIFSAIVAFLFLFFYIRGFITPRLSEAMAASIEVRLDYWRATWRMILDYPLFGSGLGTFSSLYAQHKIPFAEETRMAHNNYLQVFSEMGILGVLSFLWMWVAFLKAGWRKIKESSKKHEKALLLGCYVGVITFLINSFGYFCLYIPGIATYVWVFAAIVMVTVGNKVPISYKLKNNYVRAAALVVMLFLVGSSVAVVRRPMMADHYSGEAHFYLMGGDMERAASEADKAIKLDPLNPAFHYQLGTIYEKKGALGQAIASFEKATQLNPFVSHYHSSLGKALWAKSMGRDEALINQAVASFERARDHFLASVRHRLILAIIYKRVGRKADALAEYEKVLTLDYERAVRIEPWLIELKDELADYSRESIVDSQ